MYVITADDYCDGEIDVTTDAADCLHRTTRNCRPVSLMCDVRGVCG